MSTPKLDLDACAREPIHLPGSIQPHGLLFVVEPSSDLVLQEAGDTTSMLGVQGAVVGSTLEAVLGLSINTLCQQVDAGLLHEPTHFGTIGPFGSGAKLDITAHIVKDVIVVEVLPSGRPASAAEALASIRALTERIGGVSDLGEACQLAAEVVQRITGYDRVMVYRFMPDASGSVVAEAKEDGLRPFLNHRYPASDIPVQARELYRRSAIRIVPDVGYTPALLAPTRSRIGTEALDMSHCILRSVSPIHIRYLQNMGVGASMSVSLLPRGDLWGLIACHNSTPRLVSYEAQEACRHVGQILSQHVRAREESESYRVGRELGAARDMVMGALVGAEDPAALLASIALDLQAIVRSHGIAIVQTGSVALAGHTPTKAQILDLAAWLQHRASGSGVFVTDCLSEEYPPAEAFTSEASGVMSITLPGDDPVTLMWFRAEQVEEINWAGNPHEPIDASSGLGALNPRKSFASWLETVKGRSAPWEDVDIESVGGFGPRAAFVLQQKKVRELNALLEQANQQLAALAATDGLTGLANRRTFDDRLKMEWKRASRPPGRSLSLIMADVDFFKQYNDHHGHVMGDQCLQQIAEVLQARRRSSDLAARIGGEEFCLILPETEIEGAIALAEILRALIESLQLPHDASELGIVTASFGVATVPFERSGSPEGLLEAADKALYQAKEAGRNRVVRSTL